MDAVKSSVECIAKYVEKFDSKNQSTKNIQTRIEKLNQLIQSFNDIQLSLIDLDEGHLDDDDHLQFEDDTCTLKATMDDFISKIGSVPTEVSLHTSHSSNLDAVRLPTIQPPTFNGNLEDWSLFSILITLCSIIMLLLLMYNDCIT